MKTRRRTALRDIYCAETSWVSSTRRAACTRLLKAGLLLHSGKSDMSELSAKDLAILSAAVSQLDRPSLAVRLAAVVGMPVEKFLGWLPDSIQNQIDRATEEALTRALKVARKTLNEENLKGPRNLTHKVAVTL